MRTRFAVVTGGGSGIGAAFAVALAGEGFEVVVSDVDLDAATLVAAQIADAGGRSTVIACDVTSDDDVDRLALSVRQIDDVDLLVHCPGVAVVGPPAAIPIAHWKRVCEVNLFGAIRVVNALVPAMLERKAGHVVIVASIAGLLPVGENNSAYAASKAALVAYSESLRDHARRHNVGVSVVCPGPVRTNIGERITIVGTLHETAMRPHPHMPVLEPADVARIALSAVNARRFLVLTHPEFRDELVSRSHLIEAALDDADLIRRR